MQGGSWAGAPDKKLVICPGLGNQNGPAADKLTGKKTATTNRPACSEEQGQRGLVARRQLGYWAAAGSGGGSWADACLRSNAAAAPRVLLTHVSHLHHGAA